MEEYIFGTGILVYYWKYFKDCTFSLEVRLLPPESSLAERVASAQQVVTAEHEHGFLMIKLINVNFQHGTQIDGLANGRPAEASIRIFVEEPAGRGVSGKRFFAGWFC